MADFFKFTDGLVLSDDEQSEFQEQNLEIVDQTQEEKEPEVWFNPPTNTTKDLAIIPEKVRALEASRKRARDINPEEEELREGSGFFVKRPWIFGCSDMRKWIL